MSVIEVQVQLFGPVQMEAGWNKHICQLLAPTTLTDLIHTLTRNHPSLQPLLEGGEHSLSCLIMINGTDMRNRSGLSTPLQEGDVVDIISMITGG